MARIVNAEGDYIAPAEASSIRYTVSSIDKQGARGVPIPGHDGIELLPTATLFDTLQTSPIWTIDDTGFNFRHEVDVGQNDAFPDAGETYQVRYELQPVSGQKVVFRFLLRAI